MLIRDYEIEILLISDYGYIALRWISEDVSFFACWCYGFVLACRIYRYGGVIYALNRKEWISCFVVLEGYLFMVFFYLCDMWGYGSVQIQSDISFFLYWWDYFDCPCMI